MKQFYFLSSFGLLCNLLHLSAPQPERGYLKNSKINVSLTAGIEGAVVVVAVDQ